MVTRINKISAMFATVAIFFFAALSTAQAALLTTPELYHFQVATVLDIDLDTPGFQANPYMSTGDYIEVAAIYDPVIAPDNGTIMWNQAAYKNTWSLTFYNVNTMTNPSDPTSSSFYITDSQEQGISSGFPEVYFINGRISAIDFWGTVDSDYDMVSKTNGKFDLVYWGSAVAKSDYIQAGASPISAAPVPLPSAVWLFGSGLIGMVGMRRKMKK